MILDSHAGHFIDNITGINKIGMYRGFYKDDAIFDSWSTVALRVLLITGAPYCSSAEGKPVSIGLTVAVCTRRPDGVDLVGETRHPVN